MRRARRYFPSLRAFNFGGVKTPRGVILPVGGGSLVKTFEDIIDSPDWDTFPTPGQATNWSIQEDVYTLEGSTTPDQIIAYRALDLVDVDLNATVLTPFTQNTQADNFLSCRIQDTQNYIGCRYNQNGFVVSEIVAGVITNFSTLLVTPPFTIRLVAQGDSLKVWYNGGLAVDVTTTVLNRGRVGIVARANTSDVPLGVFRRYSAAEVLPVISNVVVDVVNEVVSISCQTDVDCAAELFIDDITRGVTALGTSHAWNNISLEQWTNYTYRIDAQSEYGTDARPVSGAFQTEGDIPVIEDVNVVYGDPATNVTISCTTTEDCNAILRVEGVQQGAPTATGTNHQWITSGWTIGQEYNYTIDANNPTTGQDAIQHQGTFTPSASVAPIFYLDLANLVGTETRAPGTCYAWNGSIFKAHTDPNAPFSIGVPDNGVIDSPSVTIQGQTFYPEYPEWVAGKVVAVGNKLWLNLKDGTNRIVTMDQSITLPEPWDADPATYTAGENYIPQLGMYAEPDVQQWVDNPADASLWNIEPAGGPFDDLSLSPVSPIIEGYPVYRATSTTDARFFIIELLPANVPFTWSLLVRPHSYSGTDPSSRIWINVSDDNNVYFDIAPDKTVTVTEVGTSLVDKIRVKYLPNDWIQIGLTGESPASRNRSVRIYPRYTGDSGSMDFALINFVRKGSLCQPIPETATRPKNTLNTISTDYAADWAGNGLESKFSILTIANCPDERNGATRLLAWDKASANALLRENATVSRWRHDTPSSDLAINTEAGDPVLGGQHCLSTGSVGVSHTMEGSRPGDATANSSSGAWDGQMDPSPVGIYLNTLLGDGPVIIRGLAWWNVDDVIDYEANFGPSNYGN